MTNSCGKEYCPDTKCGVKHPFNGGKRARCERIKGCQNSICAPFAGLGPNGFVLYDTCLQQCHLNEGDKQYPASFADYRAYLCDLYPPDVVLEYYLVNPCGADPTTTPTAQNAQKKQDLVATNNKVLLGVGGILLVALLIILLKR